MEMESPLIYVNLWLTLHTFDFLRIFMNSLQLHTEILHAIFNLRYDHYYLNSLKFFQSLVPCAKYIYHWTLLPPARERDSSVSLFLICTLISSIFLAALVQKAAEVWYAYCVWMTVSYNVVRPKLKPTFSSAI